LSSGNPKEALILRHDLCHWEKALVLAKSFAKEEISIIAKDYASQLEMDGI
jgi:WD repeat-containing protein 19